jgi:hypothetical protein
VAELSPVQVLGLIIACGSGTQLVGPGLGGWTYGLAACQRLGIPRGYPSGKLTKQCKMAHLKMVYLLKMVIFYSYVKLPEGFFFGNLRFSHFHGNTVGVSLVVWKFGFHFLMLTILSGW